MVNDWFKAVRFDVLRGHEISGHRRHQDMAVTHAVPF